MTEINKITVDLINVEIQLPEDKIIVDRKEYDNLQHNSSQGRYMTLSDVLQLLSVSRPWLLDNVLYNSLGKNLGYLLKEVTNGNF